MKFNYLKQQLPEIKHKNLEGAVAHQRAMSEHIRADIFKHVHHKNPVREAAVLALLYPGAQNCTHLVMILRKTYNGHHSGQISFPGGKKEPQDTNLWQTALRETAEEIGINPTQIDFVRSLTPVFIPISNFRVQPFLAFANSSLHFIKDPFEVEQILEIPLKPLLKNQMIDLKHDYFGQTYNLKAYKVGSIKIWGATAMILSEITNLLQEL